MEQYSTETLNLPVRLLPQECINFMFNGGYVLRVNDEGLPSTYFSDWQNAYIRIFRKV